MSSAIAARSQARLGPSPFAKDVLRRFEADPAPPLHDCADAGAVLTSTLNALQATAKGANELRGISSLHCAIVDNNFPVVRANLHRLNREVHDWNGQRALTLAVMLGRRDLVPLLLEGGADINGADLFGNSALHWATMTNQASIVDLLIGHGANTAARNVFHGTPQHYAEALGFVDRSPVAASVPVLDHGHLEPWGPDQLQEQLNLHLLTSSTLSLDFILQMVLIMADDHVSERVLNHAPPALPLPETAAEVTLKCYGGALGWGGCTLDPLPENTCLGTYTGEIIHTLTAQQAHTERGFNAYLAEPLARTRQAPLCAAIDASLSGNLLSRINGAAASEEANLVPRTGWRDGLPVLDLWTSRAIRAGEQLLWDYGTNFWKAAGSKPEFLHS